MLTRRTRGIVTAAAAVTAVIVVAVLATLADGRTASQAQTHDGGAWLVNREVGYVAHVNRLAGEVSGAVRVSEPRSPFDIDQARDVIVVHDHGSATAMLLDGSTYSPATNLLAPNDVDLHAVDGGVVLVTHDPIAAQRLDLEELGRLESVDDVVAELQGEGPGLVAIDHDDGVVLVDDAGALWWQNADGDVRREDLGDLAGRPAQLTVVGPTVVVVTEAGELIAVDDDVRRLPVPGVSDGNVGDWVLQQPSPGSSDLVAVTPDGDVIDIDLHDGTTTAVTTLTGGLPLAPIVHAGCVYSVVLQPPVFTRTCGDNDLVTELTTDRRAPTDLRLRLVNGWVWVNDVDIGTAWVTDADDDVTRIDDWDVALGLFEDAEALELAADGIADEQRINADEADRVVDPNMPDLTGPNDPPIARPDTAATRQGRPVVVDVLANDEDPNGDVLLVTEVDNRTPQAALVQPTGDGSAVQVVPEPGFTGTVRFSYTISDGRGGVASADVTVDVTPLDGARNRPPEPVTDVVTVRAGEQATINVLVNDRDPDGDLLQLLDVRGEHVTIAFTPDGTVSITPDPDQEGRLDMTYTVADEWGATAEGRILVEVRLPESNRAPIARNVVGQTLVDRRLVVDVLANDDDPDGDRLLVQAQPELLVAPTDDADPFVYLSPQGLLDFEAALAGTYVLAYTISDGSLTATALIRIEVAEAGDNRPPVAVRDDAVVPVGESRIVPVLRNDHDPDGDVISLAHWTGADGIVVEELERDRFRVTALPGAPPVVTFRYSISDGVNEPVGTTVTVLVVDDAPRLPPVAVADEVEVRAGQVTTLYVMDNDHDPSGGDLQVVGVTDPTEASPAITASGRAISLDVPATTTQGFTFGYEIANENGDRASTTVRVRIVPDDDPNRAPVAGTDIARTFADQAITIDVLANDRDPDGDPIELSGITRQPPNGRAVVLEDSRIRYEPDPGFAGTDRFAYIIVDPFGAQATGEVLIGVATRWPENRPPQAQDDDATAVVGGEPVTIDVLANDRDPDGDPLTITDVTTPGIGAAGIPDDRRAVVYRPPDGVEDGRTEVAFRYTIDDGRGGQDTGTVTVTLIYEDPLPDPPVAVDDRVGPVPAGEPVTVDALANDEVPDDSAADLVLSVTNEDLTVTADRQVTLTAPDSTRTYRYTITDAHDQSDEATITVVVQENRPPVVAPFEVETEFETAIDLDLTGQASDPDGDELYFICCDNVRGGSATSLSPDASTLQVRFTPDSGFSGRAGFAYTVDDQQGHQVAGSVTVVVAPREHEPPVAADATLQVEAGGSASLDLRELVTGPEPDAQLRFDPATASGPIEASGDGTTLRVHADIDAAGSSGTVRYTVTDVVDQSDEATVAIEVISTSAPLPEARGDTARTIQGEPVDVRVLDNDIGEGLRVVDAFGSDGVRATVAGDGGAVQLAPDPDFFGTTSASYVIRDEFDDATREVTGRIELTVIGRPSTPSAPQVTSDSRQATLIWTTPASNGAPIESFQIEHDQAGSLSLDATSTHTWTDLVNGTTYRFRVQAINEAGAGEWSPWSSPVTPDEVPGRPSPPQVRFGDGELEVTWQAPVNEGTPITTYVLEIGGAATGVRELPAGGGSGQTYTWSGLTNGASHTFRVKAVNAADEAGGDFSAWSEPEHPLTQPDAPGIPTLEGGPNYLELTWTRSGNGGDPIQAYEVQIDSASGGTVLVSGANTTTYRWADLTNGVDHRFRVRAWNRDERGGQWSAFSAPGRACDVPDAPAAPGVERGDQEVTVTWSAPGTNGCEILGYDISFDGGATSRSADAGATSTVIGGLRNGTAYTFQVRARNDQGDGAWSPASASVTPAGLPGTTPISSFQASGDGQLTAEWAEADPNGSPVLYYEVRLDGGPIQQVTSPRRAGWNGLNPGQSYSVSVRAVNDVGPSQQTGTASAVAEGRPRVTNLRVSTGGRGELTWTWSLNDGNSTTSLSFQRSPNTGSCRQSGSSYTCTGLGDSTRVSLTVNATNRWGTGSAGPVAGTTIAAPPPPPPPSSFSATVGGTRTCPEPNFTSPSNWANGTCSGYSQYGWIPARTNLTVTCRIQGWAAEGTRSWLRISGGTWSGLHVNQNTLSSFSAGIPNC